VKLQLGCVAFLRMKSMGIGCSIARKGERGSLGNIGVTHEGRGTGLGEGLVSLGLTHK
jgi:hypothetical protein